MSRRIEFRITGLCSDTIEDGDDRLTMPVADLKAMEEANFRDDPAWYFSNCDQHNIVVDVIDEDGTVQLEIPGLEATP